MRIGPATAALLLLAAACAGPRYEARSTTDATPSVVRIEVFGPG